MSSKQPVLIVSRVHYWLGFHLNWQFAHEQQDNTLMSAALEQHLVIVPSSYFGVVLWWSISYLNACAFSVLFEILFRGLRPWKLVASAYRTLLRFSLPCLRYSNRKIYYKNPERNHTWLKFLCWNFVIYNTLPFTLLWFKMELVPMVSPIETDIHGVSCCYNYYVLKKDFMIATACLHIHFKIWTLTRMWKGKECVSTMVKLTTAKIIKPELYWPHVFRELHLAS